jgi:hypothetical protein
MAESANAQTTAFLAQQGQLDVAKSCSRVKSGNWQQLTL